MSLSGPSASGGAIQAALCCVRRQGGITETGAGTEPQAAGAAADYCLPKQAGQYCSSAQEEAQLFRISCISAEAHSVISRFEHKECTCGNMSGHLSNYHHADYVVSLSLCRLSFQWNILIECDRAQITCCCFFVIANNMWFCLHDRWNKSRQSRQQ